MASKIRHTRTIQTSNTELSIAEYRPLEGAPMLTIRDLERGYWVAIDPAFLDEVIAAMRGVAAQMEAAK